MIPDLNGLEVVRRIRKMIGSNTPIIILTPTTGRISRLRQKPQA